MNSKLSKPGWRWRVGHFILYLVKADDDTYWVYHVPLSDLGGQLTDIDTDYLSPEKVSKTGRYTRQQVRELAQLAGHTDEQIAAALFLADCGDLADHHDMARMGDERYERLLLNAKRRIAYRSNRKYNQ